MPKCQQCNASGKPESWGRYRNGRLKVLCPGCDNRVRSARERTKAAKAAGYLSWGNTPEYRRLQREADAAKLGRTLEPYVPQADRVCRAHLVRVERMADAIRARWATEWLKPFRATLYQMDPLLREEKKAGSRAKYWAQLERSRLKTANYKRTHPELASLHQTRRNRRIAVAADGTLTPDVIAALKQRTVHCAYCDSAMFPADKVTDHMIPLSRGGEHSVRNLVICCRLCNGRKASLSYEEWIERIDPEHRAKAVALYEQRYQMPLEAIA